MTLTNHCVDVLSIIFRFNSYTCSDSLLLTPLCCDDIHDVTPCVSALTGCDRLVSKLSLVIENYVSLIHKKFRWGTFFLIGLKCYRDPKEEPIEKEPLMELKEIGAGSSSEQHTHQPTSPITEGFLTEKEYQQLLQDEEVLRETLEEQERAEKELEERIKKEQAEYELFTLEFGVQSNSEYKSD
ncbi:hypothetical protein Tco_0629173 [Tanacetum coccineum]|uniref:Uncharacterized protein n=1 Tax=Tanacetum coccineum TaxID=301880 RepID=A0ABQ4WSE0_9ASTR